MSLLDVTGLTVSLGRTRVVEDVSLCIAAGEFVGLVGPNGAGKTTLLRAILGLVPSAGRIVLSGRDSVVLTDRDRARRIAFLPQEREIAWPVPVETLVGLGRAPYRAPYAGITPADRKATDAAMRRMDVAELRARSATELSGGEKTRVLIARALAQETPLLLADEPTAALDPAHQIALMRVFSGLAGEGRAIVASLHDLGLAARWCSRLILIDAGRIVADGAPRDVLTLERLRSVYHIEAHVGELAGGLMVQPLDVLSIANHVPLGANP